MRNLILHIGTAKTGTTAIQTFLMKNIMQLKEKRIFIPQTPMINKNGNHRWLQLIANNLDHKDDFSRSQKFKDKNDRQEKILFKENQFILECKNASKNFETCILSSEHFQFRLRKKEEIERLRDLLGKVFDNISIVIYIRDPLKTAVSLLSTMIKNGASPFSLPSSDQSDILHLCDHEKTINNWKNAFPEADLIVKRFEKKYLEGGDVVIDFCSQFIPQFEEKELLLMESKNETLSLTGMKLLCRLNLLIPRNLNKNSNPKRGKLSSWVAKNTNDGSKYLPTIDEFKDYENRFADSLEFVRSKYFADSSSLFEPQKFFAQKKIDFSEFQIDPELSEKLFTELWSDYRKLQLRLKKTPSV